jgi:omega-6 fatty acid desaturase (delta-12 desaturase)
MSTNAAIAIIVAGAAWLIGIGDFLLLYLPVTILAASIGVWLFYVQHQFEETAWAKDPAWNVHEAALHGSSHYDLPKVLAWFTAHIGVHHVHHLASRIPYYRLPQVLRDHPELRNVSRLTFLKSLGCIRLALWDEGQKRLVRFADLRDLRSQPA